MTTKKTTKKATPKATPKKATPETTTKKATPEAAPAEPQASRETAVAAHAVAAEHALVDTNTGAFNDEVGSREQRIRQALSEREAKVGQMRSEKERQWHGHHAAPATVVARPGATPLRVPAGPDDAAAPTVDEQGNEILPTPPAAVAAPHGPPGTGVADPADLAPGQSLEPSPPGGVNIAPLPDKPGSVFSKLK